jgi:hypothetical protein
MKFFTKKRLLYGLALVFAVCFIAVAPILAQAAPAAAHVGFAGKAVMVVIAVAGLLQAVKAGINSFVPDFVKGRVAVVFNIVASIAAAFATLDPASVTWQAVILTIFGASGVFSTLNALIKGHQA